MLFGREEEKTKLQIHLLTPLVAKKWIFLKHFLGLIAKTINIEISRKFF